MGKQKISTFKLFVYIAIGYYILIALTFVLFGLLGGHLNIEMLLVAVALGVQAYFMKKIINLILGILLLGASLFWLLEFLLMAGRGGYDIFVSVMLALCVISLAMSLVLMFSYTKLSFAENT